MRVNNEQIKSVKINEAGKLEIVIEADVNTVIENSGFSYETKRDLENRISKLVAEKIFEVQGKVIIADVLKNVNWAELVRSKVVAKAIKEIINTADLDNRY